MFQLPFSDVFFCQYKYRVNLACFIRSHAANRLPVSYSVQYLEYVFYNGVPPKLFIESKAAHSFKGWNRCGDRGISWFKARTLLQSKKRRTVTSNGSATSAERFFTDKRFEAQANESFRKQRRCHQWVRSDRVAWRQHWDDDDATTYHGSLVA